MKMAGAEAEAEAGEDCKEVKAEGKGIGTVGNDRAVPAREAPGLGLASVREVEALEALEAACAFMTSVTCCRAKELNDQ